MFGDKKVRAEVADRTCSIAGCRRKYVARGYCGMHYKRWSTTGQLGPADLINKPPKGLVCQVDGCYKGVTAKSQVAVGGVAGDRQDCHSHDAVSSNTSSRSRS